MNAQLAKARKDTPFQVFLARSFGEYRVRETRDYLVAGYNFRGAFFAVKMMKKGPPPPPDYSDLLI